MTVDVEDVGHYVLRHELALPAPPAPEDDAADDS